VSRLPIRVKLTSAFALATMLMLAGAALFVYLRLEADLDESVDEALRARALTIAAAPDLRLGGYALSMVQDPEDSFVQVVTGDGRVLEAVGSGAGGVLTPAEARRATRATVVLEREVPGIDGTARVLARPAMTRRGEEVAVVVGQSLEDRDETLDGLVASFAIGGPLAILLASALGYGLASAGLAPVEAMRRRAGEISLSPEDGGLPLPAARDEVRRLGETLNEMLERLRRSFDRERRFVSDASHELRTPVAVLKTELEGALQSGDYGLDVGEALAAAVEECDRLAQLAEDLLVVARAGEGDLPVRREPLAGTRLLENVRARFADRAARQGRRIRVDDTDGDRRLNVDPLRVQQALGNLVDNSLRHGDGEIVLRVRRTSTGAQFEVSDEGPGFEPGFAAQAFERFARGDPARTRGGAGLGLAIVRAIAEAHGGRVAIVSGDGATVRLWLPDEGSEPAVG
jgi:two-component system, OmpR family, sensor kinase